MQPPTMGGAGNLAGAGGVHLAGLAAAGRAFGTTAPHAQAQAHAIQPPTSLTGWGDAASAAGAASGSAAAASAGKSAAHIAAAHAAAAAAAAASAAAASSAAGVGAGVSTGDSASGVTRATGAGTGTSIYHGIGQGGVRVANGTASASDEEAYRAAQMKRRKQLLDIQVEESRSQWVHPDVGQEETIIFHRVRALINLTGLSQIFICRLTGVTPASLSQYLRCNFKGRQDLLEDKLEIFVNEYLEGKYDGSARRAQPGRRALSRRASTDPTNAVALQNTATAHHHALMQRQAQAQAQAHGYAVHAQVQQAQAHAQAQVNAQVHAQAQAQAQAQARYNQHGQHGMYARYTQQHAQQQYMQHEYLLRQQQQAQLYHQHVLARQQQQARAMAAAAAAKAAAPPMKPLPPTEAVERAYHAYHSAVLDITSTNAEPLLVPIEIDVTVSEEEAKRIEAELKKAAEEKAREKARADAEEQAKQQAQVEPQAESQAQPEGNENDAPTTEKTAEESNKESEKDAMEVDSGDKDVVEYKKAETDAEAVPGENNETGETGEKKGSLEAVTNADDGEETTSSEKEKDSGKEMETDSAKEAEKEGKEMESEKEKTEDDTEAVEAKEGSVQKDDTGGDKSAIVDEKSAVEGDTVEKEREVENNGRSGVKDLVNELLNAAVGKQVEEKRGTVENGSSETEKATSPGTGNSDSTPVEGNGASTARDKDGDEVMGESSEKDEGDKTEGQTEKQVKEVEKEGKVDGDGDSRMEDVNKTSFENEDQGGTKACEKGKAGGSKENGVGAGEKQVSSSEDVSTGAGAKEQDEITLLPRHLKYYTQWDVNERRLSPEEVADGIIAARKVHPALKQSVAMAIRRQLLEAGVACAVPPSVRDWENRRRIAIRVRLIEDDDQYLEDAFDWDICMGEYNSPELIAQYLCSDHGVSQYHVPQVACAIRRKVAIAQAIAYGDTETRKKALSVIPSDDPLREQLPPLTCGVRKLTRQEVRNIAEKRVRTNVVDHVLRLVDREAKRRHTKRVEEEEILQLEREEKERREREEQAIKQAKEAEIKKIERKLSMLSDRVCDRIGVASIPYTTLKLAKDKEPAVWTQGLLIRKKEGKNPLPFCNPTMVQEESLQPEQAQRKKNTRGRRPSAQSGTQGAPSDENATATPTPKKRGRRGRPKVNKADKVEKADKGEETASTSQRKRRASSRNTGSTKRARKS